MIPCLMTKSPKGPFGAQDRMRLLFQIGWDGMRCDNYCVILCLVTETTTVTTMGTDLDGDVDGDGDADRQSTRPLSILLFGLILYFKVG